MGKYFEIQREKWYTVEGNKRINFYLPHAALPWPGAGKLSANISLFITAARPCCMLLWWPPAVIYLGGGEGQAEHEPQ